MMLSSNSPASITISSGGGRRLEARAGETSAKRPLRGEPDRPGTTAPPAPLGTGPASRYGEDRRLNLPAAGMALALSGLLLAALVQAGVRYKQVETEKLVVVDLSVAPPPAPPPPPENTPAPPETQTIVPQPPIVIQDVPPLALAMPEPSPPPVTIAVPPSPPAPSPPRPPSPPTTIQADDLGTRMLSGEPPRYPRESRRHREEGTVVLELTLDFDGTVAAISIAQSSGFERLDEAALRAVRKWRWAPAVHRGHTVRVKGLVEIPFILRR